MDEVTGTNSEIQVISDDEGIAVLGDGELVDRFIDAVGFPVTRISTTAVGTQLQKAGSLLAVGSTAAEHSGRWMKLTADSAAVRKTLPMVRNSTTGNFHASLRAADGTIAKNLQFLPVAAGTVAPPAAMAMAATAMTQLAMQQVMTEITDYLETIDRKVDDILANQKMSVLADMRGVGDIVDDAMAVREAVGGVSETTWSKVQSASLTIATTRNYALQQLASLADDIDQDADLGDIAKIADTVQTSVKDWLAVLARCIQLQEAVDVLELDRVFDESPEELNRHREGLKIARTQRWQRMSEATGVLLHRMDAAAHRANASVLLRPFPVRRIISSRNTVVDDIASFREHLGIERSGDELAAKPWLAAVGEARDKAVDGAVDVKKRLGRGMRAFKAAVRNDGSEDDNVPSAE